MSAGEMLMVANMFLAASFIADEMQNKLACVFFCIIYGVSALFR